MKGCVGADILGAPRAYFGGQGKEDRVAIPRQRGTEPGKKKDILPVKTSKQEAEDVVEWGLNSKKKKTRIYWGENKPSCPKRDDDFLKRRT